MAGERISVIIPAWNAAGTIGRAVESLLAQTRRPDEVIVVDDGSPDDIASAVRRFGTFVRYIRKENGGVSSARNVGIGEAKGDFISFLDADDLWRPPKLQKQMQVFADHPDVGLVACRYSVEIPGTSSETYPKQSWVVWDQALRPNGVKIFEMAMHVWTSAVVFRREVLGEDRFDQSLPTAEDRDLWVRLVARTSIWFIGETLATLMASAGSLSRSDLDRDCRSMLTVIRRHAHLMDKADQHRWIDGVYRRWAGTYLGLGRPRQALRPALRRLRHRPLSAEGWWVLGKAATLAMAPASVARSRAQPDCVG